MDLYGGVEGLDEKKSYSFGRISYLLRRNRICSDKLAISSSGLSTPVYMYKMIFFLKYNFKISVGQATKMNLSRAYTYINKNYKI